MGAQVAAPIKNSAPSCLPTNEVHDEAHMSLTLGIRKENSLCISCHIACFSHFC